MRLLIAGSRTLYPTLDKMSEFIDELPETVTVIVSGGAKGVDSVAQAWAVDHGMQHVIFYPGWNQHGHKYAAYVRNNMMADYADWLLAIWDGKSPGTKHMINAMKELDKPTWVHIVTDSSK